MGHYLRARSFLTLRIDQQAVRWKAIEPCPNARSVLTHHLESTNPALRDCPKWNDTLPGSWQVLVAQQRHTDLLRPCTSVIMVQKSRPL